MRTPARCGPGEAVDLADEPLERGLREVAELNTGVIGGELLALAGALRWRWSCPRPWLDLDHLAEVVVPTILGTFRDARVLELDLRS